MGSLPPEMTSLIEKYLQKRNKICIELCFKIPNLMFLDYDIVISMDNEINFCIAKGTHQLHIIDNNNIRLIITGMIRSRILTMPEEIITELEKKIMEHNFGINPLMKYEHFI